MIGTPRGLRTPPLDSSPSALHFIHRLLTLPAEEHLNLDELLKELSTAFEATAAGLASFPDGVPLCLYPARSDDCKSIIDDVKSWLNQQSPCSTLTVPRRAGGSCLLTLVGTPEQGGWLLWLEDDERTTWNTDEAGLLVLAGQALMHRLTRDETPTPWAVQLDCALRRQRMEAAANIVRRLAHDFGNVLTVILGFSELALTQEDVSRSPLHEYLSEVHRGAQNGTQYISQLRLFARRHANSNRSCNLSKLLIELTSEWRETNDTKSDPISSPTRAEIQVKLHLLDELPAAALESEALRQVLTIVLDNAHEAIAGTGVIDVSARIVQVSAGEAYALFGNVRAGKHLEIRIADNGVGLTPEAQHQLFAEPFFSTKSSKRGFGLAMAYGILSAYRGGLELLPRREGGTIARLIVPIATDTGPSL